MTASTDTVPTRVPQPTGVGLIGLGTFGRFCLDAYLQMPEVQVVAIADPAPAALAAGAAQAPFAHADGDATLLLERPDVHVVHICASPDQHLPLVLAALAAGKHVICEKPLGLSLQDFDMAQAAAVRHDVVLSINLVLRHDLLHQAAGALVQDGVLGRPYRVSVDNYADEAIGRGPEHWLWHPARSGGLALAADVHWFDVVCRLLGPAQAIQTWQLAAEVGVGPRHLITTAHPAGAVASIYHVFDTPPRATRCTMLVACELGEARVHGWIPHQLTIVCPADRLAAVARLLGPTARPNVSTDEDNRATLVLSAAADRHTTYQELIRTTLRQLLAAAHDHNPEAVGLAAARTATIAALAAADATAARRWVTIGAEQPLGATS